LANELIFSEVGVSLRLFAAFAARQTEERGSANTKTNIIFES
jgi:hypothetical protein